MCHIRYDGGKYDFCVVPVDDTYGEECYRMNNSFIRPGEYEALEQRRCHIRCNVHSSYAKKHLTKFGYINMLCVIQNVVKTLKQVFMLLS